MMKIFWLSSFAFVFSTASVLAQTATTSLRGTVYDSTGARVPGAQVSLIEQARGFSQLKESSSDGSYQFLQIAPGRYTVTVAAPGFQTGLSTGVMLAVNTPASLDFHLSIGTQTTEVQVNADVLVNATDGRSETTSVSGKSSIYRRKARTRWKS